MLDASRLVYKEEIQVLKEEKSFQFLKYHMEFDEEGNSTLIDGDESRCTHIVKVENNESDENSTGLHNSNSAGKDKYGTIIDISGVKGALEEKIEDFSDKLQNAIDSFIANTKESARETLRRMILELLIESCSGGEIDASDLNIE